MYSVSSDALSDLSPLVIRDDMLHNTCYLSPETSRFVQYNAAANQCVTLTKGFITTTNSCVGFGAPTAVITNVVCFFVVKVLEKHIASIFRVEDYAEHGKSGSDTLKDM
jgi:hypothetical protein